MISSIHDIKPLSSHESSFEVNRYRAQLFGMNMEDNMTTTKNLNSIAVRAIFDQVLKMDPKQKAPGAY